MTSLSSWKKFPEKYSVRSKSRTQDAVIAYINEIYKAKFEDAYASSAGGNRITVIMNEHQKALSLYLQERGKVQKEGVKIRA